MTWQDKLATILLTLLIALAMLVTMLSFAHGLTTLLRPTDSWSAPRSDTAPSPSSR